MILTIKKQFKIVKQKCDITYDLLLMVPNAYFPGYFAIFHYVKTTFTIETSYQKYRTPLPQHCSKLFLFVSNGVNLPKEFFQSRFIKLYKTHNYLFFVQDLTVLTIYWFFHQLDSPGGTFTVPCFSKKSETRDALCAGVLSWCNIQELLRHKIGRFLRKHSSNTFY